MAGEGNQRLSNASVEPAVPGTTAECLDQDLDLSQRGCFFTKGHTLPSLFTLFYGDSCYELFQPLKRMSAVDVVVFDVVFLVFVVDVVDCVVGRRAPNIDAAKCLKKIAGRPRELNLGPLNTKRRRCHTITPYILLCCRILLQR